MSGWTMAGRSAIGIDLGGRSINALQLSGSTDNWRVEAAVRLPRCDTNGPFDEREALRLADVLHRHGFTGRRLVVAAPSDKLMNAVLQLPPRDSGAPIDQIVQVEFARTFDVEAGSFETAVWDLPTPDHVNRDAHVLAVGLSHDDANALCSAFESAGLEVEAIDTKPWAVGRATRRLRAGKSGITATLDLEWKTAVLALFHRDAVLYERAITDGGLGPLHQALIELTKDDDQVAEFLITRIGLHDQDSQIDVNPAGVMQAQRRIRAHFDGIVRDLDDSMRYASRQYPDVPFDSIMLTGDAAAIPGIAEHLSATLNVEVSARTPSEIVPCVEHVLDVCGDSALLPALGLAMFDRRQAA